jgi:hypothetical protein
MKNWPAALQLLTVGFYVALSLLLPTGVGLWVDLKTSYKFPLYTLTGLGVGTLVMVYGVYRMVWPFLQEAHKEKERKNTTKRRADTPVDGEDRHHSDAPHEEVEKEE